LPPELDAPPLALPPALDEPPLPVEPLAVALPVEGDPPPAEVPPLPRIVTPPPPPEKPVAPPALASPPPPLEHAISWLKPSNAENAAPHPVGEKRAITPRYRTHDYEAVGFAVLSPSAHAPTLGARDDAYFISR
jgi:hypothetical protein